MHRAEIINLLIEKFGYKSYCEIGTSNNDCFDLVECDHKIGIDPNPASHADFQMTSDKFFEMNNERFDIVFIDGLHHAEQVYKDIINSLEVLEEGGTIVCHDMNPPGFSEQYVPRQVKQWNGNCYLAWIDLRTERNDLEMFVIDTDEGVGIIRRGKQPKLIIKEKINYNNFDINRQKWLNLQPVEYFLEWLKK